MGKRYKFSADISAKHGGVTGSCMLVSVHSPISDVKFVVDCGLYQGEPNSDVKNDTQLDFNASKIDFVLVTHNHTDHIGRIPMLYKNFYYGKVYTTVDTKKMMPLALNDNAKIIKMYAEKNKKKPIYTSNDVDSVVSNLEAHEYGETFEPYPGIKVTMFKNGHLIGAAIILVQITCEGYEDINLLFTGDYKSSNIFFYVPELPDWVKELPLHIICESTYGMVDAEEVKQNTFINNLEKWLNDGIKTIVVMALSQGRHQEVNYDIKMAQRKTIDPSIPIKGDGNLAIKYTNMYKYGLDILPEMRDFLPFNHSFVQNEERESIINATTPQIIVTTSGMGTFGPAQEYIARLIERPDVGIHFTSYLSADSLGRRLLETPQNEMLTVGAVVKRKRAKVLTTGQYSSHAKRNELIAFLKQFRNIRSLCINHGEPEVKESFAMYCKEKLQTQVAILGDGYTLRMNSWEIIKSIREKN